MRKAYLNTDDVGHTVIMGPTGAGMSVLVGALVEEYKRHGVKLGVVDVGYYYSRLFAGEGGLNGDQCSPPTGTGS